MDQRVCSRDKICFVRKMFVSAVSRSRFHLLRKQKKVGKFNRITHVQQSILTDVVSSEEFRREKALVESVRFNGYLLNQILHGCDTMLSKGNEFIN